MAWTEQLGAHNWRVRYPTRGGHTASVSGFTSRRTAENYASILRCHITHAGATHP